MLIGAFLAPFQVAAKYDIAFLAWIAERDWTPGMSSWIYTTVEVTLYFALMAVILWVLKMWLRDPLEDKIDRLEARLEAQGMVGPVEGNARLDIDDPAH